MNNIEYIHDNIGFVSLVDRMQNDTALKVVNSARISHASHSKEFNSKDKKLCGYLFEHGHTSPFRHTYYTFHIKAPLFVFRQWLKYQVGSTWRTYEVEKETVTVNIFDELYDTDKGCSWNELSGRYAKLKPEFYYPEIMRRSDKHNKQGSISFDNVEESKLHINNMRAFCENAYNEYKLSLSSGVAKEIARMILPQNVYSEAYWTISFQGLMHFLNQRLKKDAQQEIQNYANCIYELVFEDFNKMGIYPKDSYV